jgi:uncharacterized damage-inducible protein DinB
MFNDFLFLSMKKEIQSIIRRFENVNTGEPWFGRAVFTILEEVDPKKVYEKPAGTEHSLIDLLYHMNTWAGFTLKRLEKDDDMDMAVFEKLDWRMIDPKQHTWKKGLAEFKNIHKKIIAILKKKDDLFLNGLIEHNIYHLGQVAYLKKLLD